MFANNKDLYVHKTGEETARSLLAAQAKYLTSGEHAVCTPSRSGEAIRRLTCQVHPIACMYVLARAIDNIYAR
jgi:hypothetical protein